MMDEREKLNRLEDMKTKLNSKNYEPKMEHRNSFRYKVDKDVPDFWGEKKKENFNIQDNMFKKTSFFKKFFVGCFWFLGDVFFDKCFGYI